MTAGTDPHAAPEPPAPDPDEELRRRQAPRYGEYATPEEVAALRGPDAVPPPRHTPPPPAGRPIPGVPPPGHTRSAGWDGIATFALLAFGAYNVVSGIVTFLDMRGLLAELARDAGIDDFRAPESSQGIGYGLIGAWAVLFVIAIVWSMRRMQHGRTAFWVPLLIGIVAVSIASIACVVVLSAAMGLDVPQNRG
jgi:hypothetical protein